MYDNSCMRMHPRRFLLLLLPGLAATLITACALNPVSGNRELALLSEADELRLGQENNAVVRKQYGVYANARLQAYVQQVGEHVAAQSHRPQLQYSFTILDTPDVNAFALPGGYIYITRGILAYLNSEAELAAVLGHEIGHVTARHAVRQYTAAKAANIGFAIGSILVPELGSRAGQSLLNTLGGALLSGYGREHELEADRLGAEYLARSDYDPKAMIDVITLLKNQELFEQTLAAKQGRTPRVYHGVFASHPSADERLQQVVGEAQQYRNNFDAREEHLAYLTLLDGLAWGDSEAQGVRHGNDFFHKGLDFGVQFPTGWRLHNNPERLLAVSAGKDALVEMQTTSIGKVRSPQEYLVAGMKLNDLHDTRALKVNGLPAYTGITRMQTPFGPRDTRVAVVFLHGQAFRFFGVARDASTAVERTFLDTVQSLHTLRPEERTLARGQRVELTTIRAGDHFATLARRASLKDEPEAILRLINGKYPQGEPAPGELVKLIH
jgi:predicted Zn-dependent protease